MTDILEMKFTTRTRIHDNIDIDNESSGEDIYIQTRELTMIQVLLLRSLLKRMMMKSPSRIQRKTMTICLLKLCMSQKKVLMKLMILTTQKYNLQAEPQYRRCVISTDKDSDKQMPEGPTPNFTEEYSQ